MAFVHGITPPVVHRDLKSPNVLLHLKGNSASAVLLDSDDTLVGDASEETSASSILHRAQSRATTRKSGELPDLDTPPEPGLPYNASSGTPKRAGMSGFKLSRDIFASESSPRLGSR
jgi:hypothetical protein